MKKRNCFDSNTCNAEYTKIEEKKCSEILEDIGDILDKENILFSMVIFILIIAVIVFVVIRVARIFRKKKGGSKKLRRKKK
ncbi:hypothetical protein CMI46_01705 [Candidatus Pacearchaeota archaeon]|nr:hypothetical protein [Candidatus Pacearchaeota archaeon]|tara:strand:+ start:8122 stop:8364 length:243 start_codon:yes stop_codon:yes gene_type:complete